MFPGLGQGLAALGELMEPRNICHTPFLCQRSCHLVLSLPSQGGGARSLIDPIPPCDKMGEEVFPSEDTFLVCVTSSLDGTVATRRGPSLNTKKSCVKEQRLNQPLTVP
ncbi:hypothetical protein NDU88_001270 [Pleurodeles waltl]|uniref:Uncharacterized protein n=1 Tax=Pleurodeles waltl TaxID=8319 RepID=A0AAV7THT9_PLEWA|nr:hypothetical protein NDU88_001270 [Pleurodeles waltl]